MRRGALVLLVLLPIVALAVLAWPWRSDAPEPADWRVYVREPALAFAAGAWRDFSGRPNHLAFAGLYRLLLSSGLDLRALSMVGWLLATVCVAVVVRLASPRGRAFTPLLACLVFSPAFAANWLLVERLRVFVPVACVCVATWLLRRAATRGRMALALSLVLFAVFTHENGSLLWIAVLPSVVAAARVAGGRALPWVALFVLAGNAALFACYDESARDYPGLVAAFVDRPAATAQLAGKAMGIAWPDLFASTDLDAVVVGAGMCVALLVGVFMLHRCGDAQRRASAVPWVSLALAGAVQGLAVAHTQAPQSLTDLVLRELCWGTWLLPVGVIGLWANLSPRRASTVGPYFAAAMLVLLVQDWERGGGWLRAEGLFLRQSEALLVFADLDRERPPSPRPAVPGGEDRQALRRLGLLARATPVLGRTLHDLGVAPATPFASVGNLTRLTPALAVGGLMRTSAVGDLVLLLRQRGADPPMLCKIAVPNHLDPGAVLPWEAELSELEAFVDGDEVSAFAFDLETRALSPLHGRFRWRAGEFVAVEATR